jgi:hypothetical protein
VIVSEIAIYKIADGSLAVLGPVGTPLREGQASVPLPAGFNEATFRWDASLKTMVEQPMLLEATLVAQVKAANETLVKGLYSQNYGKQKKYSRKQQEVIDFRSLNGSLGLPVANALTATLASFVPGFTTMNATEQKKKFRFAMAQARKRNVSIDVIIGEMEARLDTVEDQVAAWEATELEAILAIKAATTAAGKRAAYAAINWAWQPVF